MNRRKRSVVNRRRRSLLVERLEPRYVMALGWVGPDNGNSSYGHAANWNPAQVPTATDDVNIQGFTGTISLDANAVSRAMRVKMSSVDIALAGKTLSLADLVVTDVGDVGPASLRVVGPGTIVVEQAGAPNGSAKIGQRGQAGTLTLDGVEQARVEGGVYLGGLPAVQGGENTSDGVLQVNNSTLNTLTLEIGDEQSSKGSANFDNSFLDLQSPGLPAPGALPPGFPLPGPGLGLGNLIVGVEGTGTTAFKNSSGLVGPIFVGRQGKGDLTVEGGTFYGYDHFRVGFSAQGDVQGNRI